MDSLIGDEYEQVRRLYDLKGSTLGRLTKLTEGQEKNGSGLKTLKDLNFKGIDVEDHYKKDLLERLKVDSKFLGKHGLIDYSVLLLEISTDHEPKSSSVPSLRKNLSHGLVADKNGDLELKKKI
mmetsp:Transcript_63627/g.87854  ORF Transcript_63627/g.87854 Transcript_63627/m.87854 type:complete len:124 (+) Transcript_63627:120-491(+)